VLSTSASPHYHLPDEIDILSDSKPHYNGVFVWKLILLEEICREIVAMVE